MGSLLYGTSESIPCRVSRSQSAPAANHLPGGENLVGSAQQDELIAGSQAFFHIRVGQDLTLAVGRHERRPVRARRFKRHGASTSAAPGISGICMRSTSSNRSAEADEPGSRF